MAHLDRMGIRFNYSVDGSGLPLVALHGLGGRSSQPRDLIGTMQGYRVVCPDCRAHGETVPVGPSELLSFDQLADDTVALIGELDLNQPILLGISMGAGICANIAVRYPGLARALVLVRPAWLDRPNPSNLAMFPVIARLLREQKTEDGKERFKLRPDYLSIKAASPAVAASLLGQFDAPLAVERAARLERLPASCPVTSMPDCQAADCPTLVVATDRDLVHPLEFGRIWAEAIPQAEFAQVPSKSASAVEHINVFRQVLHEFLLRSCQEA